MFFRSRRQVLFDLLFGNAPDSNQFRNSADHPANTFCLKNMSWKFLNIILKRNSQQDTSGGENAKESYDSKIHELPRLQKSLEDHLLHILSDLSVIEGNLYTAGSDAKFFYVTSCNQGEGKSISAIALALGLAENDRRVLLIDSNAQHPSLHIYFQTPISPGLTFLGNEGVEANTVIRKTIYANLSIMPLGGLPQNQHCTTNQILRLNNFNLCEQYDFVVVDGHSILNSSHASLVAKKFDGLILIVQCERTKKQAINEVVKKIHQSGGRLLGVVLNKRRFYIPNFLYNRI